MPTRRLRPMPADPRPVRCGFASKKDCREPASFYFTFITKSRYDGRHKPMVVRICAGCAANLRDMYPEDIVNDNE